MSDFKEVIHVDYNKLKFFLKKRGISQKKLSELTGLSLTTVSSFLQKHRGSNKTNVVMRHFFTEILGLTHQEYDNLRNFRNGKKRSRFIQKKG